MLWFCFTTLCSLFMQLSSSSLKEKKWSLVSHLECTLFIALSPSSYGLIISFICPIFCMLFYPLFILSCCTNATVLYVYFKFASITQHVHSSWCFCYSVMFCEGCLLDTINLWECLTYTGLVEILNSIQPFRATKMASQVRAWQWLLLSVGIDGDWFCYLPLMCRACLFHWNLRNTQFLKF